MATATWALPGDDLDDFVLADAAAAAPSTAVPATYPIAIAGHPYKLELDSYGTGVRGVTYRRTTLDAFRQAADQSATPGEQSRSTDGYWLRSERTWLYGSGQLLFDSLDDGVDNLIRRQRWLNNWNCEPDTVEGLKMLRRKETVIALVNASPAAPGLTVAAGAYTYVQAIAGLYRVDSAGATLCTGFANTTTAVASDGATVWVATAIDATHIQFYSATAGSTFFTAMAAGSQVVPTNKTCQRLFYGNGFLLACCGDQIYSISTTGAVGTVIDTISTISSGLATISSVTCSTNTWYFSMSVAALDFPTPIYKLSVDSSGAFGKVSVALPILGPTEVVACIKVIGQTMLVGTSKGFRVATIDSSGNLTVGALIPVVSDDTSGAPSFGVTEFARFGSKVVASYASTREPFSDSIDSSFKAGRPENGTIVIDLGLFVTTLQPSWWFWWRNATDTATTSCFIAEHKTTPILIERNQFNVLTSSNLISPCAFVTSWVSYGLDASKSFIDITLYHDTLVTGDSIKVYYQAEDSSTWTLAGTSQQVGTITNPDPFQIQVSSRRLRFAFVMVAGSISQSTTPRVRRWELRAFPAPKLTDEIMLPVILHDRVLTGEEEIIAADFDTRAEYDYLAGLAQAGTVVLFQEGTHTEQVKVSKLELQPSKFSMGTDGGYRHYQGICLVRLLSL